jgi:hypothetical protein
MYLQSAMRELSKEKAAAKQRHQHFHVKPPGKPAAQIGVLDNLLDAIKIGNFATKK